MNQPTEQTARDAIARGHEPDNAHAKGIAWAVFALSVLAVVAILVNWGLTHWLGHRSQAADATAPPQPSSQTWNEPPLSAKQSETLRELRGRETEQLTSYDWVDRDADIVRIPIEQAIEIVSEQGLPDWSQEAAQQQPTDSP